MNLFRDDIEFYGESATTQLYWQCECGDLKPKTEPVCVVCSRVHTDCSDARVIDVVDWLNAMYAVGDYPSEYDEVQIAEELKQIYEKVVLGDKELGWTVMYEGGKSAE